MKVSWKSLHYALKIHTHSSVWIYMNLVNKFIISYLTLDSFWCRFWILIISLKNLVGRRYFSRHQEFTEWFSVLESLVILVQFCLKNNFVFILKKMLNERCRICFYFFDKTGVKTLEKYMNTAQWLCIFFYWFGPTYFAKGKCVRGHSTATWTEFCHFLTT